MRGAPQTLYQAILNALTEPGAEDEPLEGLAHKIRRHTQDFLSQRFGAAMLKADSPKTEAAIKHLWKTVTEMPPKEEPKS